MSDNNTPYRDDPDSGGQVEEEQNPNVVLPPANSHFRRPLGILAVIVGLLSFLTFGLLVATLVLLEIWDFASVYQQEMCVRDLFICLIVNALLTIPGFFIQIHILINMAVHLTMSWVILAFSVITFNQAWPTRYMCQRWKEDPITHRGTYYQTPQCVKDRNTIRIMMGTAGGCAIAIAILMVIMILIRAVALYRTRFWEWTKLSQMRLFRGWGNATGFTVQFSLSVLPAGTLPVVVDTQRIRDVDAPAAPEQERLIETEG